MHSVHSTDSFLNWAAGLPFLYFLLNGCLRWSKQVPKTVKGTNGSNIVACELTSAFVCCYVGIAGSIAWLNLCPDCNFEDIENDRMYGRSVYFERHLAAPLLSYQFWNFVICFVLEEMRDVLMIMHHAASGLCAYFSIHPFLHYYGLFFFGVPEITSIPLSFVILTKSFPILKKNYPEVYEVSKWSFGIFFLIIRLIMWTYVSFFYWIDIVGLLKDGTPHSYLVVAYYCFANIVLTGMQYFWGYKIINQMTNGTKLGKKILAAKKAK